MKLLNIFFTGIFFLFLFIIPPPSLPPLHLPTFLPSYLPPPLLLILSLRLLRLLLIPMLGKLSTVSQGTFLKLLPELSSNIVLQVPSELQLPLLKSVTDLLPQGNRSFSFSLSFCSSSTHSFFPLLLLLLFHILFLLFLLFAPPFPV